MLLWLGSASLLALAMLLTLTAIFIWSTRCAPSRPTSRLRLQVVAHRGESCGAPENTLRAIALAHERGAKAVEFDVGVTRDGHLVLMHDLRVDRTTDGHGRLRDLTLEQVRRLRISDPHRPELPPERVPTLDEALSLVAALGLHADIEIKEDIELPVFIQAMDELLTGLNLRDQVWISSFHPQHLYSLRRARPELITALNLALRPTKSALINALLGSTWLARYLGLGLIKPDLRLVDEAFMARWRALQLPVLAWTVNTSADKARMAQLGAHIITDCTAGTCSPRGEHREGS